MYKSVFEVVFNHGGKFMNNASLKYVGESNTLLYDLNKFNYFEILSILKEMSYVNVKKLWYLVKEDYVVEGWNCCVMIKMHVIW